MNKKKIVFISYHNWETKRQGGFHKLAEGALERGLNAVFFSFSRPYYSIFKKNERLNSSVFFNLIRGQSFNIDGSEIVNVTFPTLDLPIIIDRFLPKLFSVFLRTNSFQSFKNFKEKYLSNTDYFVIESNESVLLFDKLKKHFPNSLFIYRPSDPIVTQTNNYLVDFERKIIENSDWNFIVNDQGAAIYKKNFVLGNNYSILPNGVDTELYTKSYPIPNILRKRSNILYVGARDIEWELILFASKKLTDRNFIVITPSLPPIKILKQYKCQENIEFINGILPNEVPQYVTNCDIIMVPNPRERYKKMPWGITAKYYQAMVANKPIVAFHDTSELMNYGIKCTYSYYDFVEEIKNIDFNKEYKYNHDFLDWIEVKNKFYIKLEQLSLEK
jgi:hypothetical protein